MPSIDELFKVRQLVHRTQAVKLMDVQKPYLPSNKRKLEVNQDPSEHDICYPAHLLIN